MAMARQAHQKQVAGPTTEQLQRRVTGFLLGSQTAGCQPGLVALTEASDVLVVFLSGSSSS